MDDKDYKDLDHFFKSRLNQKDAKSNGWDVPSDSILDSALQKVLVSKPKRRFPFLLLFTLLLFPIIAGTFLVLRSNDKAEIKNLNKQVALLQSTLLEKQKSQFGISSKSSLEEQEDFFILSNTSTETNNLSTRVETPQVLMNSDQENINETLTKFNETNNYSISEEILKKDVQKPIHSSSVFSTKVNKDSSVDKNIGIDVKSAFLEELFISRLISPTPLLKEVNRKKESFKFDLAEEEISSKSKWSYFITLGHLYSTFNMTNLPSANYSLTDYDKYYSGWELGIGTVYELTKNNQLRTDLRFNIINNESHFRESSSYVSGDELTNSNGDIFYNTNLNISSPIGQHSENLLVDVTNHNLEEGDATENFADIYQKFNAISLNTVVSQNLLNSNGIKIELSGGVGFNYFLNARQDIKISMQHHDEEMGSKTVEVDGIASMNRFHVNGQLGLSIGKVFMQKFFLGFNTGYQRSLTSIRKSTSLDQSKTFIGSYQSGIKIVYHF